MTETWTPLKLVAWTQGYFARAGVDAPRLTAEILLAHVLHCDRLRLYLDFDKPVAASELAAFRSLVKRRSDGEPAAYLIGKKEFFGRSFQTDRRALIPRPETELLAETALQLLPQGGSALDLCTGSGCLAVTLSLERPGARVIATELSSDAAALARENAAALGAHVEILEGDLFAPVPEGLRFHVILANPPYVPTAEISKLARELSHEPRLALDGGVDGLDLSRRIVEQAPRWLVPGGSLVLEMHESHPEPLARFCHESGFTQAEARLDLAGLPRFLVASGQH